MAEILRHAKTQTGLWLPTDDDEPSGWDRTLFSNWLSWRRVAVDEEGCGAAIPAMLESLPE